MSKQIYEELVAAGAPELPEGYYILVQERNSSLFLAIRISIKRERDRLWDKNIGSEDMYLQSGNELPETDRIARQVAKIWNRYLLRTNKVDAYADVRKYIGRHP